eukprot:jgi/Mesen1/3586/ME000020S03117
MDKAARALRASSRTRNRNGLVTCTYSGQDIPTALAQLTTLAVTRIGDAFRLYTGHVRGLPPGKEVVPSVLLADGVHVGGSGSESRTWTVGRLSGAYGPLRDWELASTLGLKGGHASHDRSSGSGLGSGLGSGSGLRSGSGLGSGLGLGSSTGWNSGSGSGRRSTTEGWTGPSARLAAVEQEGGFHRRASVAAGDNWGQPAQRASLREAIPGGREFARGAFDDQGARERESRERSQSGRHASSSSSSLSGSSRSRSLDAGGPGQVAVPGPRPPPLRTSRTEAGTWSSNSSGPSSTDGGRWHTDGAGATAGRHDSNPQRRGEPDRATRLSPVRGDDLTGGLRFRPEWTSSGGRGGSDWASHRERGGGGYAGRLERDGLGPGPELPPGGGFVPRADKPSRHVPPRERPGGGYGEAPGAYSGQRPFSDSGYWPSDASGGGDSYNQGSGPVRSHGSAGWQHPDAPRGPVPELDLETQRWLRKMKRNREKALLLQEAEPSFEEYVERQARGPAWRRRKLRWLAEEMPGMQANPMVKLLNAQRSWVGPADVAALAELLLTAGQPLCAFRCVKWARQGGWYAVSPETYASVTIVMCRDERKLSRPAELHDMMVADGVVPTAATYSALIAAHLRPGSALAVRAAYEYYSGMKQAGGGHTQLPLELKRALLEAMSSGKLRQPFQKEAEELLQDLQASGEQGTGAVHRRLCAGAATQEAVAVEASSSAQLAEVVQSSAEQMPGAETHVGPKEGPQKG